MVFVAEAHVATLTELKHYLSTPDKPVSSREIIELMESMTPEERHAFKRNPDIPKLNYWDLLDAEERKFKDG
jgi:hypothetical protein